MLNGNGTADVSSFQYIREIQLAEGTAQSSVTAEECTQNNLRLNSTHLLDERSKNTKAEIVYVHRRSILFSTL